MRFQSILSNIDQSSWGFRIRIPEKIARDHIHKNGRRCLCILNNKLKIQVALISDGNGGSFISINKEVRTELGLSEGEVVFVEIEKDNSKYGIAIAPEMEELFEQDPLGSECFHSLSAGKQRTLLYIIAKPKNAEIRIRKGLIILDYLRITEGKLDFQELNQALKQN